MRRRAGGAGEAHSPVGGTKQTAAAAAAAAARESAQCDACAVVIDTASCVSVRCMHPQIQAQGNSLHHSADSGPIGEVNA